MNFKNNFNSYIMKTFRIFLAISFLALSFHTAAQKKGGCSLCKMDIKDQHFIAQAELNGNSVSFDAIECLVNHLKLNETTNKMMVADYQSGKLMPATTAFYLKSPAIQSPMGANISAYATEKAAQNMQKLKGGEVLNWTMLQEKFKSSKFGSSSESHHHHTSRPDIYAPTGIVGDHLHGKGGKMLSAKYMYMAMNGNRTRNKVIEDETIYEMYSVAPQNMSMQMIMLSGMYAVSDNLTFMAMQNFVLNDMKLTHKMSSEGMPMLHDFATSSTGFGDLKLAALIGILAKEKYSFHFNTGLSIPLGSISKRDKTPMSESAKLPYAMQLGTGTYDATLGGTLRGSTKTSSWGIQHLSTFRIGNNSQGYNFGNQHQLNIWGTWMMAPKVSSSLRLNGFISEAIKGKDAELMPMMVPTANGANYQRQLVRVYGGINSLTLSKSIMATAEVGFPILQNNAGIFMNESLSLNTGLRFIL
jgi:nitrous oxide reductase accessory protein NosL